ncbi:hypothetical protein TNCV_4022741 [Trichonephila clavipes]|nr:hypothetical protein TNCV_4022741 [Trichonephila clavipes]
MNGPEGLMHWSSLKAYRTCMEKRPCPKWLVVDVVCLVKEGSVQHEARRGCPSTSTNESIARVQHMVFGCVGLLESVQKMGAEKPDSGSQK